MAKSIALFWVSFVISITGYNAANQFNILHSPDSLKFLGSTSTLESLLEEIICACLGLSVDENIVWKGLHVTDPFNTPEAVVEVFLEGIANIGNSTSHPSFLLTIDENDPNVFGAVQRRIKQRYTTGGNKLLDIKLSNPKELTSPNFVSVFGHVKVPNVTTQSVVHLNYSLKEDYQFLNELETLKAITAKVASGTIVPDSIVDFYNFRFGSLRALSDLHGPNSTETKEAKGLLDKALGELSKAFVKAYDGSVLVSTIIAETAQTRRPVRSPEYNTELRTKGFVREGEEDTPAPTTTTTTTTTTTSTTTASSNSGNETPEDEDFAIMFNILLWFGIVYSFVMLAIVYGTMNMDPGRDTVIYRLTTPRIKKEL